MKQGGDEQRAVRPDFRRLSLFAVVAFAALTLAAHAVAAQEEAAVSDLRPGRTVARELAGGASHTYTVMLEAGQFVHVVVEQKGVDVALLLFDQRGGRVAQMDSPNGVAGPEPLSFIASEGGAYRLEVRAIDKEAKAGLYEVRIEELRAATERDRKAVEAKRLFDAAETWRTKQTLEARRASLEQYASALRLWRELGDSASEARTLARLGWLRTSLGDMTGAVESYTQAAARWHEVGDQREEADALGGAGYAYARRDEYERGIELLNRALALQRAAGDGAGERLSLSRLGGTYRLLNQTRRALELFTQALESARAANDTAGQAGAFENISELYVELGEFDRALDFLNRALELYRARSERRKEGIALGSIGNIYHRKRDFPQALAYLEQALAISRAVGDRREEIRILSGLGAVLTASGEPRKALPYLEQALQLQRAAQNGAGEAVVLGNLAGTHAALGEHERALELFQQALALWRQFGDRRNEHYALARIARLEMLGGDLAAARRDVEQAIEIAESLRAEVAVADLRASFFATVQDYYDLYITLLMRQHRQAPAAGHDAEALRASERGRARRLLDSLAEAGTDIRQGVDPLLLEREREARKEYNARGVELTRLNAASPAAKTSDAASAVEAARRKLSEALFKLQAAEAQVRAASPRYAALARPEPPDVRQIQAELLDADTALVEYALGSERSFAFVLTATSLDTYELPKASEIEEAARDVYGLLTARYPVPKETAAEYSRRVAEADARYEAAAANLSRMVLAPLAVRLDKKRLLVVADGALQYVPFAALPEAERSEEEKGRLEVAGYRPLILKHEIVSLPSASALAAIRSEARPRNVGAMPSVAVFADPVFDAGDVRVRRGTKLVRALAKNSSAPTSQEAVSGKADNSRGAGDASVALRAARDVGDIAPNDSLRRLVFSREEAAAIAARAGPASSRRFVDFDANRAAATGGDLSRFSLIHFATHSFVNSNQPELSGIVLSLVDERGHPQDGFLRLQNIYQMRLPAELVTLSACRTAIGREVRGEGLMSLTRGFMYAGARRVAASLWKVDDAATAELMESFYSHLLSGPAARRPTPADALRRAQLELMRRPNRRAPFYWAAFMLQGEWR